MELIVPTLDQLAYLFSFILLGFLLMKIRALPEGTAAVISKLENNLLLPAMVLRTFLQKFTLEVLRNSWQTLLYSFGVLMAAIVLAKLFSALVTKDGYMRNIYTYGLSFSNFGFMGYAVVDVLFPEIELYYVIFTLPMWTAIYVWGTQELLISDGSKKSLGDRLKNFVNPMFISLVIGMILGLCGVGDMIGEKIFVPRVLAAAEACMSPLAMLLVGITLSKVQLKKAFTDFEIYVVSVIRLVVYPLLFILAAKLFDLSGDNFKCALIALSMPLGLTTIVVPAAYGRDTTKAASMALISHLLSCITIPLIFSFIN